MYSRDSVDGGRIMNGGQLVAARVNQADAGSALIDPRSRVLPVPLLARVHYQVHVHVRAVHVVHACKYGRESWIAYGDTTRHSSMLQHSCFISQNNRYRVLDGREET